MADYRFERDCRTAYSEAYNILDGDEAVGRVDLHFTSSAVYGGLSITDAVPSDDLQELIATIDEDLVMSADPYRTNFVVRVYQGKDLGVFSDVDSDDDEEDVDEEEEDQGSWNGHGP